MTPHIIVWFFLICTLVRDAEGNCSNPGKSPGSHMVPEKDSYKTDESITYVCDPLHYAFGKRNIVCLEDGTWQDPPPFCYGVKNWNYSLLSSEEHLTVIVKDEENGTVESPPGKQSYSQGVKSDNGVHKPIYALEINDTRKYDAVFELCEIKIYAVDEYECEELETPNNTKIVYYQNGKTITNKTEDFKLWWGTIAAYTCDSSCVLQGFPLRNCTENSIWDGTVPECVPIYKDSEQCYTNNEGNNPESSKKYFILGIILTVASVIIAVFAICIAWRVISRMSKWKKSKGLQQGQVSFSSSSGAPVHAENSRSVATHFPHRHHKVRAIDCPIYGSDEEDEISPYAEYKIDQVNIIKRRETTIQGATASYLEIIPSSFGYENINPKELERLPKLPNVSESEGGQVNVIKENESPSWSPSGRVYNQGHYLEMNPSGLGYENKNRKPLESFPGPPQKPLQANS